MPVATFDHEAHVRRTLELAREAGARGDEPFGAVLVKDDEEVLAARNAVETGNDIALHPELTLARRAANRADADELALYSSTEPCSMCAGGIVIAGLRGVVFSVAADRADDAAGERGRVAPAGAALDRHLDDAVLGEVLKAEGEAVHRECW